MIHNHLPDLTVRAPGRFRLDARRDWQMFAQAMGERGLTLRRDEERERWDEVRRRRTSGD